MDGFSGWRSCRPEKIRASGVSALSRNAPSVRRSKIDYPAHGVRLNVEVVHLAIFDRFKPWPVKDKTVRSISLPIGRHLGSTTRRQGWKGWGTRSSRCVTRAATRCAAGRTADTLRRGQQGDPGPASARARATGADVMVTACLKCQIHFNCALMDTQLKDEIGIEMVDLDNSSSRATLGVTR